jgi:glycosyltransferase involved in cell wall biosynthesis
MRKRIFFVVQGLFLKSDSIGYDCVFQYELLKEHFGDGYDIRIFAENFDSENYPGVPTQPLSDLLKDFGDLSDVTLIYHFCEGWVNLHRKLREFPGELVVRWHNNTPPWFFAAAESMHTVPKTIGGFNAILELAKISGCKFWCNSAFTMRQLAVLGVSEARASVVYPGSRYLNQPPVEPNRASAKSFASPVNLLFVSRIVPHKGHRHIIPAAALLSRLVDGPITVTLAGRPDDGSFPGYTDELRSLADGLNVDLRMPGEVDHDELQRLYHEADAFVCLSEHEGFGIPIFEAVRNGVPLVAFANTAVREFVEAHPLAVRDLDYTGIAARLAALSDPGIRDFVIRWQTEYLAPRYTRESLLAQLDAGLAIGRLFPCATNFERSPGSLFTPPACSNQMVTMTSEELRISRQIQFLEEAVAAVPLPPAATALPREICDNFVTLYDLRAYDALLESSAPQMPGEQAADPVAGESNPRGVWLPPLRFARRQRGSLLRDGEWNCALPVGDGHLVFGPYLRLTPGSYAVEFQIGVCDAPPPVEGEVTLDVFCDGFGQLASCHVWGSEILPMMSITLEFTHEHREALIEFRIETKGFQSGVLSFKGVYLREAVAIEEMLAKYAFEGTPAAQTVNAERLGARSGKKLRLGFCELTLSRYGLAVRLTTAGARRLFAEADAARDRCDWKAAALLYEKGLQREPNAAPMWVQYGHALKESGYLVAAERAYQQALRLDPVEPDTHLQMGHLLKVQGRLNEAADYYLRAIELSPAPWHASRELAQLAQSPGLSEDDLRRKLEPLVS